MTDKERAEQALLGAGFAPKESRNATYRGDWLRRHGPYCDSAELYGDGGCTISFHIHQSDLPVILAGQSPPVEPIVSRLLALVERVADWEPSILEQMQEKDRVIADLRGIVAELGGACHVEPLYPISDVQKALRVQFRLSPACQWIVEQVTARLQQHPISSEKGADES